MVDDHEQFEALAVGHVLGGLDDADAVAFRSHLQGCRECRSRVAELRDIAADLAQIEQDERARRPLRTQLPARVEPGEDDPSSGGEEPRGVGVRHVTAAALLVLVLAAATAFWNFHLRTVVAAAGTVVEQQEESLTGLAEGVPVQADLAAGVNGLVVVGDDRVAFVLTGMPPLGDGERLLATLEGGSLVRPQVIRVAAPGGRDPGVFSAASPVRGASRLVVTREGGEGSPETLLQAEIGRPQPIAGSRQ